MKKYEEFMSKTAKVYLNSVQNKAKFINEENVVYNEDNRYALVYTKKDYDNQLRLLEAISLGNDILKGSIEDIIYDNMLIEGKVIQGPFVKTFRYIETQSGINKVIKFRSKDNHMPLDCVIKLEDAKINGSDVIFIQASSDKNEAESIGFIGVLEDPSVMIMN